LRPKYLLIERLKNFITLSGRRWNPHGSSKEGRGKKAGSKKASQEGGSKEEITFTLLQHFFDPFFFLSDLPACLISSYQQKSAISA
jgi:hypothetical protein